MKAFALIFALVLADQLSKWATEALLPLQERFGIAPFFLYRTYNDGIAFSLFSGAGPWPLIALALVVMGVVIWMWRSTPPERTLSHVAFALIIAGAIGNVIDRARLGYVIDMFLFDLEFWSFAVFNVADTWITFGAALILLDEFLAWRRGRAAS